VKKKKKIKIGVFLVILSVGILAHHWLSKTNEIIKNYGISFGVNGWFFILLSIVFIVLLSIFWWRNNFFGINFIMVGGWINLIDRIIFGYVRDYWQIGRVYNNLADWIIQTGIIILLVEIWIIKLK
jgi:lipoprotein signal peptidase